MANIFLSVPILGKPELKMIYSVYQSILSSGKHKVRLYFNENDSLISRVRNVHISLFFNEFKECDYFMSIDSDIEIVNAFNNNNIFNKLIEHDKDFVGGLYPLKQNEKNPLCASIPESKHITRENIPFDSGLIEMKWLSSGCWCIKRSAVEKMINAYPELTYIGDDNVSGKDIYGLYIPEIFEVEAEGHRFKKYLSEDWSFCRRWKDIGGEIYADTSIVLRHIGKKSHCLWDVTVEKKQYVQDQQKEKIDLPEKEENSKLPKAGFNL